MKPTKNIIIVCTGSVATIKLPLLVQKLKEANVSYEFNIKVVTTERAKHFFDINAMPENVAVLDDCDEWGAWERRGDPVLHIELSKWADLVLIAPLSANSLAKIATGICDNLCLCLVRAWITAKPLLFCPAMNTRMYDHPITSEQINRLKSWGYIEIPCISKTLMCGDTGHGAMAEVQTIVEATISHLKSSRK